MDDVVIFSGARVGRSFNETKKSNQVPQQSFRPSTIEKVHSKEEFQKYFLSKEGFEELRELCLYGYSDSLKCRWSAWRAFLGSFEIGDENKIRSQVKKNRDYYYSELDKFTNFRSKQKLDAFDDNPLSTSAKNPWNSFYEDSELKAEIKRDVERTYQDVDFFLQKKAQDMLTNILFVWAKQNPDLSYRQGMNDIAGFLTYVCFTENFEANNPDTDIYDYLNDEKHAEADIYTLFRRIMELNQKEMFRSTLAPTHDNKEKLKKKPAPKGNNDPARPNLPVVHRAAHIQEVLLPQLYSELASHLTKMGVEPQIYMIRWIRCMLSREYNTYQSLLIWDALFSYNNKVNPKATNLELLDYLCVSMLIYISEQILEKDENGMILGCLIKYPQIDNVKTILRLTHEEVIVQLKSGKSLSTKTKEFFKGPSYSSKFSRDEEDESPSKEKIILFNPGATASKQKEDKKENGNKNQTKSNSSSLGVLDDPITRTPSTSSNTSANIKKEATTGLFEVKKAGNVPLFTQQSLGNKYPIFPSSQPLLTSSKVTTKVSIFDDNKSENKDEEKKEIKNETYVKIEENNKLAIQNLKEVMELLKQETEGDNKAPLEDARAKLGAILSLLELNTCELPKLK